MFVIDIPYFNLNQIYESGQCPRWIKIAEDKYVIPFRDKALLISQKRDRIDWDKCRFLMHCSEDDFFTIWFNYFDLRTDYLAENQEIKRLGGKFKIPANKGKGIHILRQDEFEGYVLAKLISYVGFEKAGKAMNHIAETCGIKHVQSMREAGKITWYEWPTPEMILKKHDKLGKMGKINNWLKRLCESIINDGFDISQSDNQLYRMMCLADTASFPTIQIWETLEKNFDCKSYDFSNKYLSNIANKGLVYFYLVHHILDVKRQKEMWPYGIGR